MICKGHNVNYGTAVEVTMRLGGAKVVEAGYANECTLDSIKLVLMKIQWLYYILSHIIVSKKECLMFKNSLT